MVEGLIPCYLAGVYEAKGLTHPGRWYCSINMVGLKTALGAKELTTDVPKVVPQHLQTGANMVNRAFNFLAVVSTNHVAGGGDLEVCY